MAREKDAGQVAWPRGEDMFTAEGNKSLRRGRRVAPRTEVCRPCLVWFSGQEAHKYQGVVLDLNPHGMKIRMLESLPAGKRICVQMMRDEEFQVPLSPPIAAQIIRNITDAGGFIDHGVRVILAEIKRPQELKPVKIEPPKVRRRSTITRMHTVDYTVGEREMRRTGRSRG
ncbi:MAG: hypothetical protein HYV26_10675 [Candidatus Hydrogenedentes bacterium]|nr:hypothetical protein [Candidatus Hydrogenedentota bacterium]